MAKGKFYKSRVKKQIQDDTLKLLKKDASRIFNMANKRITRLEGSKDVKSPSFDALKVRRGDNPRFYIKGKNADELRREMAECQHFLNLETSSLGGARKYNEKITKMFGDDYSSLDIGKIFEIYHQIQERRPDLTTRAGYREVGQIIEEYQDEISHTIEGFRATEDSNRDDIIQKTIDRLTEMLEDITDIGDVFNGASKLF